MLSAIDGLTVAMGEEAKCYMFLPSPDHEEFSQRIWGRGRLGH